MHTDSCVNIVIYLLGCHGTGYTLTISWIWLYISCCHSDTKTVRKLTSIWIFIIIIIIIKLGKVFKWSYCYHIVQPFQHHYYYYWNIFHSGVQVFITSLHSSDASHFYTGKMLSTILSEDEAQELAPLN